MWISEGRCEEEEAGEREEIHSDDKEDVKISNITVNIHPIANNPANPLNLRNPILTIITYYLIEVD